MMPAYPCASQLGLSRTYSDVTFFAHVCSDWLVPRKFAIYHRVGTAFGRGRGLCGSGAKLLSFVFDPLSWGREFSVPVTPLTGDSGRGLVRRVKMLKELTRALHGTQSLATIIDETTRITREGLEADAVTLFLYSKSGAIGAVGTSSAFERIPCEVYDGRGSVYVATMSGDPLRGRQMLGDGPEYAWPDAESQAFFVGALQGDWHWVLLPLDGPNRTFGVLRVIRRHPLSELETSRLRVVASLAAVAISHLRREAELDILQRIQERTASPDLEVGPIAQIVADELIGEWTEFAACVIRLANRQGELEIAAVSGAEGVDVGSKSREKRRRGQSLPGKVYKTGKPEITDDIESHIDEFQDRSWIIDQKFRTYGCFPIKGSHDVLGTISLFIWYRYTFFETKQGFVRALAAHLANAIEIKRLLLTRNDILTAQRDATSSDNIDRTLKKIVESAQELTHSSRAYLALKGRNDGFVRTDKASGGLQEQDVPPVHIESQGHIATAIKDRKPVLCNDVKKCTCGGKYIDFNGPFHGRTRAELLVPLMYGDQAIGVLSVASDDPDHYHDPDRMAVEALATQAGAAVQRTRFLKAADRLERLPLPRDDRQGLYNAIATAGVEICDVNLGVAVMRDDKGNLEVVAVHNLEAALDVEQAVPISIEADAVDDVFKVLPKKIVAADNHIQKLLNQCADLIAVRLYLTRADSKPDDFGLLLLGAGAPVSLFEEERHLLGALGRTAASALKETKLLEDRQQVMEAAEQNAHIIEVAEIAAGVAHDANGRLAIVISIMDSARDNINSIPTARENSELQADLEVLGEELQTLSKSFRGLNAFERLHEVNFDYHSLHDILEHSIVLMNYRIRKRRIRVRRDAKSTSDVIYCDRDRITRVFVNLIGNAIDAMKERGELFVATARHAEYAEARITDDGIGMDDDVKNEIFKPLFTTKKNGTGLGLVVCKAIVEGTHHGRLDFETRRSKGTTFYVRLPLQSPLESRATNAQQSAHDR